MKQSRFLNAIFVLSILSEYLFGFVFFDQHITSQTVNAIGFFISSLLVGVLLIVKFYNKEVIINTERPTAWKRYGLYFFGSICFLILNIVTNDILQKVDFSKISDIILCNRLLAKEFLNGKYPYSPGALAEFGYKNQPGNLSMQWLPLTVSTFFNFDARTVTFAVWCIGAIVIVLRSMQSKGMAVQLFTMLMISGCYLNIGFSNPHIVGVTMEIMICGYYMLLIAALNQKNVIFTGFCIATCLLSRYYVILWLPLYFFILFVSTELKQIVKSASAILAFMIILYIAPFGWRTLLSSYLNNYGNISFYEWTNNLNAADLSTHLFSGTGFAHLFYLKYRGTDLYKGYLLLKKIFFIANIGCLAIMGWWYGINRNKLHYRIFVLASFKLFLSIFLALIVVPYRYLMVTAIYVSIAIFAEQARFNIKN